MAYRTLTACILVVVALAWRSGPALRAEGSGSYFSEPSNCANCENGCRIHTTSHRAPLNQNGDIANPHSDCLDIECTHPLCGGSANLDRDKRYDSMLDEFDKAVAGDIGSVVALTRDYPEWVSYNRDRNALQIQGCNEEVVAGHFVLTPAQVAAIAPGGLLRRARPA